MNVGFFELALQILIFFGGSMGLPLGLPPGEEDPRMAQIAPEECLLYASWSGLSELDAQAGPMEAWMAQPGVQAFLERARVGFADYLQRQAEDLDSPIDRQALATVTAITRQAFQQPAALYIRSAEIDLESPRFEGAAVIRLGPDRAELDDQWRRWRQLIPEQQARPARFTEQMINEEPAIQIRFAEGAPELWVALDGDLALLATSAAQLEAARRNLSTPPPKWLTDAREAMPVKRFASMSYINLAGVREAAKELLAEERRFFPFYGKEFFDSIQSAQSLAAVSGVDEQGFLTRTRILTDQELSGLFALIDSEPLPRETWRQIPLKSTAAIGTRLEADQLLQVIRGLAPGQRAQAVLDDALKQLESFTEVPLEDELLAALGNEVVAHFQMTVPRGLDSWTVTLAIEDDMTFPGILEQITGALQKTIVAVHGPEAFASKTIERDSYFIFRPQQQGNPFGIPSVVVWGILGDSLVISHSEAAFLAYRAGGPAENLANLPAIKELYEVGQAAGWGGPIAVVDLNLGSIFEGLATAIDGFLRDGNIEIEELGLRGQDIPPAKEWYHEVQPNITGVFRTADGFQIYQRQTYPGASPLVTFGGFTTGAIPFLIRDHFRDKPTR